MARNASFIGRIAHAYRHCTNVHDYNRLLALEMAQQGEWTLAEIGKVLGKHRATIARWLGAYRQGGIDALLERGHGGRLASLNSHDIQAFKEKLLLGTFKTAKQIGEWLKKRGFGTVANAVVG